MDNGEPKYMFLFFGFVALCILIAWLAAQDADKAIFKTAIENGYTQKVERHRIVWIKEEK